MSQMKATLSMRSNASGKKQDTSMDMSAHKSLGKKDATGAGSSADLAKPKAAASAKKAAAAAPGRSNSRDPPTPKAKEGKSKDKSKKDDQTTAFAKGLKESTGRIQREAMELYRRRPPPEEEQEEAENEAGAASSQGPSLPKVDEGDEQEGEKAADESASSSATDNEGNDLDGLQREQHDSDSSSGSDMRNYIDTADKVNNLMENLKIEARTDIMSEMNDWYNLRISTVDRDREHLDSLEHEYIARDDEAKGNYRVFCDAFEGKLTRETKVLLQFNSTVQAGAQGALPKQRQRFARSAAADEGGEERKQKGKSRKSAAKAKKGDGAAPKASRRKQTDKVGKNAPTSKATKKKKKDEGAGEKEKEEQEQEQEEGAERTSEAEPTEESRERAASSVAEEQAEPSGAEEDSDLEDAGADAADSEDGVDEESGEEDDDEEGDAAAKEVPMQDAINVDSARALLKAMQDAPLKTVSASQEVTAGEVLQSLATVQEGLKEMEKRASLAKMHMEVMRRAVDHLAAGGSVEEGAADTAILDVIEAVKNELMDHPDVKTATMEFDEPIDEKLWEIMELKEECSELKKTIQDKEKEVEALKREQRKRAAKQDQHGGMRSSGLSDSDVDEEEEEPERARTKMSEIVKAVEEKTDFQNQRPTQRKITRTMTSGSLSSIARAISPKATVNFQDSDGHEESKGEDDTEGELPQGERQSRKRQSRKLRSQDIGWFGADRMRNVSAAQAEVYKKRMMEETKKRLQEKTEAVQQGHVLLRRMMNEYAYAKYCLDKSEEGIEGILMDFRPPQPKIGDVNLDEDEDAEVVDDLSELPPTTKKTSMRRTSSRNASKSGEAMSRTGSYSAATPDRMNRQESRRGSRVSSRMDRTASRGPAEMSRKSSLVTAGRTLSRSSKEATTDLDDVVESRRTSREQAKNVAEKLEEAKSELVQGAKLKKIIHRDKKNALREILALKRHFKMLTKSSRTAPSDYASFQEQLKQYEDFEEKTRGQIEQLRQELGKQTENLDKTEKEHAALQKRMSRDARAVRASQANALDMFGEDDDEGDQEEKRYDGDVGRQVSTEVYMSETERRIAAMAPSQVRLEDDYDPTRSQTLSKDKERDRILSTGPPLKEEAEPMVPQPSEPVVPHSLVAQEIAAQRAALEAAVQQAAAAESPKSAGSPRRGSKRFDDSEENQDSTQKKLADDLTTLVNIHSENADKAGQVKDLMKKMANLKKAMKNGLSGKMSPEAIHSVLGMKWEPTEVRPPPEMATLKKDLLKKQAEVRELRNKWKLYNEFLPGITAEMARSPDDKEESGAVLRQFSQARSAFATLSNHDDQERTGSMMSRAASTSRQAANHSKGNPMSGGGSQEPEISNFFGSRPSMVSQSSTQSAQHASSASSRLSINPNLTFAMVQAKLKGSTRRRSKEGSKKMSINEMVRRTKGDSDSDEKDEDA